MTFLNPNMLGSYPKMSKRFAEAQSARPSTGLIRAKPCSFAIL